MWPILLQKLKHIELLVVTTPTDLIWPATCDRMDAMRSQWTKKLAGTKLKVIRTYFGYYRGRSLEGDWESDYDSDSDSIDGPQGGDDDEDDEDKDNEMMVDNENCEGSESDDEDRSESDDEGWFRDAYKQSGVLPGCMDYDYAHGLRVFWERTEDAKWTTAWPPSSEHRQCPLNFTLFNFDRYKTEIGHADLRFLHLDESDVDGKGLVTRYKGRHPFHSNRRYLHL